MRWRRYAVEKLLASLQAMTVCVSLCVRLCIIERASQPPNCCSKLLNSCLHPCCSVVLHAPLAHPKVHLQEGRQFYGQTVHPTFGGYRCSAAATRHAGPNMQLQLCATALSLVPTRLQAHQVSSSFCQPFNTACPCSTAHCPTHSHYRTPHTRWRRDRSSWWLATAWNHRTSRFRIQGWKQRMQDVRVLPPPLPHLHMRVHPLRFDGHFDYDTAAANNRP